MLPPSEQGHLQCATCERMEKRSDVFGKYRYVAGIRCKWHESGWSIQHSDAECMHVGILYLLPSKIKGEFFHWSDNTALWRTIRGAMIR